MIRRGIVSIGGSASRLAARCEPVQRQPAQLAAALFAMRQSSRDATSILPQLLAHKGRLPAAHARDGEPIAHGCTWVTPRTLHFCSSAPAFRGSV